MLDFEVVYVNRMALGDDTRPDRIVGRTVLELYPHTAGRRMFEVFCEVVESGAPVHLDRVRAEELVDGSPTAVEVELSVARLGDGLLVSWRMLDT